MSIRKHDNTEGSQDRNDSQVSPNHSMSNMSRSKTRRFQVNPSMKENAPKLLKK